MLEMAEVLWPINRSLSGPGVRATLEVLESNSSFFQRGKFDSGSKVFDWVVPDEWIVHEAHIEDGFGNKVCNYFDNNLHLVGYSVSFEGVMSLEELETHLFSIPEQPEAIPYVTSYYEKTWGFCISDSQRKVLQTGNYKVVIRTSFYKTGLDFGEIFIPGKSDREVFFSTYICHPSMANNELSGPVLASKLASELEKVERFYSYRFLFIPETIGSIAYMSEHLERMQRNILCGYVLTCVGDDRTFSFVPSRSGDSVSDKIANLVFEELGITPKRYSWSERGSDERQYCSPGADLPICSVTRSKYGTYPEYHTSLDTLGGVVTARGLQQSFDYYMQLVKTLEDLRFPRSKFVGEPQLGKRGLYPNLSIRRDGRPDFKVLTEFMSHLDGKTDLMEAAELSGVSFDHALNLLDLLLEEGLVSM